MENPMPPALPPPPPTLHAIVEAQSRASAAIKAHLEQLLARPDAVMVTGRRVPPSLGQRLLTIVGDLQALHGVAEQVSAGLRLEHEILQTRTEALDLREQRVAQREAAHAALAREHIELSREVLAWRAACDPDADPQRPLFFSNLRHAWQALIHGA